MKVFEGDEWKHAGAPAEPKVSTRAALQRQLDNDLVYGRITHAEWSRRFDELSEPGVETYMKEAIA